MLPAVPVFDPLAQLNPVDGVMVLDWVKLADDGSGDLILRVYEAVGGEAHARLAVNAALGKATVRECSIMEDARLDAELPAAFADGDPSVARTAQGAMLSCIRSNWPRCASVVEAMVEILMGMRAEACDR